MEYVWQYSVFVSSLYLVDYLSYCNASVLERSKQGIICIHRNGFLEPKFFFLLCCWRKCGYVGSVNTLGQLWVHLPCLMRLRRLEGTGHRLLFWNLWSWLFNISPSILLPQMQWGTKGNVHLDNQKSLCNL